MTKIPMNQLLQARMQGTLGASSIESQLLLQGGGNRLPSMGTGYHSPAGQFFSPGGAGGIQGDPGLMAMITLQMAGGAPGTDPLAMFGLINLLATMLPPDVLRNGARQAIVEGRTSQGRVPTNGAIDRALGESWKPRTGPASAGVVPMSQLDYNDQLGGGGRTIRQSGCFMTSLTMAATKITGDKSLNPRVANQRIRDAGGYSGSNLVVGRASNALGMKVTGRKGMTPGNAAAMGKKLDDNLDAGKPVVAGVDYKAGKSSAVSNADHFITITQRNADGSYTAVDPAGGKEIKLTRGADGMLRGGKYTVSEMVFLDKA